MKKVALILCFLAFSLPGAVQAQEIDPKVIELSNQVIEGVYQDILGQKANFIELQKFDGSALSEERTGMSRIKYQFTEVANINFKRVYLIDLTVVDINEENPYELDRRSINWEFPLLGVKIIGTQKKGLKTRQYDIKKSLKKHAQLLVDYEQEFLPIKLSIESVKETFLVGEDIYFTVSLENVDTKKVKIEGLSSETLFFLYNNKVWGAREVETEDSEDVWVLKPGRKLTKMYKARPFRYPREFEIELTYTMAFQGVQPKAKLQVKVVE